MRASSVESTVNHDITTCSFKQTSEEENIHYIDYLSYRRQGDENATLHDSLSFAELPSHPRLRVAQSRRHSQHDSATDGGFQLLLMAMDGPSKIDCVLTLLLPLLISVGSMEAAGRCLGRVETSAMSGPPHACSGAASRALAVGFVGEWTPDGRQKSCSVILGCFTFSRRCPVYKTRGTNSFYLLFSTSSRGAEFPFDKLENGLASDMQFEKMPKEFIFPVPTNVWPSLFSLIALSLHDGGQSIFIYFHITEKDDIDSALPLYLNNSAGRVRARKYNPVTKKSEVFFYEKFSHSYIQYEGGKLFIFGSEKADEMVRLEKKADTMTFTYLGNITASIFNIWGMLRKPTRIIEDVLC